MPLKVQSFVVFKQAFNVNMYVLHCEETKQCIVIDPGIASTEEWEIFLNYVEKNQLKVESILNTHGHIDHICGDTLVKSYFDCSLMIHEADAPMLLDFKLNGGDIFGINVPLSEPTRLLKHGDTIALGNLEIKVIHTPGHSLGGVCYWCENYLFAGDSLFRGGVGRTDLCGGNFDTLIHSLKTRVLILPDDCQVLSGHGASSFICDEKRYNQYLK